MAVAVAETWPPRTSGERARDYRRARLLVGWAVLLLILVAWVFLFRPTQLGGPATFIVVAGDSMEPTLHNGDLVVLRAQDTYVLNDVITFSIPDGEPGAGSLVVHRIVDTEGTAFVPRGDNRDHADNWRPTEEHIRGSLWLHWPRGGEILMTILRPPLVAALAGGAVTMWLLMRETGTKEKKNAEQS